MENSALSFISLLLCQAPIVGAGQRLPQFKPEEAKGRSDGNAQTPGEKEWFDIESVFSAAKGAHFQSFSICTLSPQCLLQGNYSSFHKWSMEGRREVRLSIVLQGCTVCLPETQERSILPHRGFRAWMEGTPGEHESTFTSRVWGRWKFCDPRHSDLWLPLLKQVFEGTRDYIPSISFPPLAEWFKVPSHKGGSRMQHVLQLNST